MTYDKFLEELGRASLSVRKFADLLCMKPNSISNYARTGEVPNHLAVIAILLAELRLNGIAYEAVLDKAALGPKKARGRAKSGHFGGDLQERLDFGEDS